MISLNPAINLLLYASNDYMQMLPTWQMLRDCEKLQVQKKPTQYLVGFETAGMSEAERNFAQDAFRKYSQLAVYADFFGATRRSMIGSIFRESPIVEVPESITESGFLENVDGRGNSIEQFSKKISREMLVTGYGGVFVDTVNREIEGIGNDQFIMPFFTYYPAESIINAEETIVNGLPKLSFVRLLEYYSVPKEGLPFEYEVKIRFRILYLDNGVFKVRIHDDADQLINEVTPTHYSGTFDTIPFQFIGAIENTSQPNTPPLQSIAELGIAHFRNSADYEYNSFLSGQSKLVINPADEASYVRFNGDGTQELTITPNDRLIIANDAKYIQVAENNICLEAMKNKEKQIALIGGQLFGGQASNETAEAARIRAAGVFSQLETIVGNISEAIERMLEIVGLYFDFSKKQVTSEAFRFSLNREFFPDTIDAAIYTMLRTAWREDKIITTREYVNKLVSAGVLKEMPQNIGELPDYPETPSAFDSVERIIEQPNRPNSNSSNLS